MFAPYTARFLEDAGISRGMKVLDVGTGAGDVALLAANLVRQQGTIVGIDFNAQLIQTARARASTALGSSRPAAISAKPRLSRAGR